MEIQTFPTYQSRFHDSYVSISEDIPSFEDAFDSDSLRRFYQQQQGSCCSAFLSTPVREDSMFEDASTVCPSDKDSQSSPLLRYINKFSQEAPMHGFKSAINLSQQLGFDNAEMANESFLDSFVQRDSYESLQVKSLGDAIKQSPAKPVEGKKVIEMKGKLNMTMSYGNFTLKGQSNVLRTPSQGSDKEEFTGFEKLLKTKKIFKIQKDIKPKSPTKQKALLQAKNKASSPQSQPIKLPFTSVGVFGGDMMAQANFNHYEGESAKAASAPLNFIHIMQGRGYSPQQMMGELQKFMHSNTGDQNISQQKI